MSERKKFWQMNIWQPPGYIGYKVGAVLIALLLWGYVITTQSSQMDTVFTVPLEVRNLSSELAVLDTTNQVQVRVQGSSADINNLNSGDIIAFVDLSGVIAGSATLEVQVELPDNIKLVSLTPKDVSLELAKLKSGSFPLQVKISGDPAENYMLLDAVSSPTQIMLSGAEDYIDQVASVFVSADVGGFSENFNQNLQIEVTDFSGNNISEHFSITPSVASILIPVVYDLPEKSVAVTASVIGTPAKGYQISRIVVEPSTVRAFGDLDVLNNLYYLETAPIDVTGLKKNYTQTVSIVCGNNISLSATTVTVVIQIEPVSTATFVRNLIYAQNLSADLSVNLPSLELEVAVSGPETYIEGLTANDIVPIIDCNMISEPGEYVLPLSATLPANISLVSISPAEVTVMVTEADTEGV